ncbi:hypothetical protein [Polyangium mundeleinium]|uniref:HEAT repeat domain-containing protein n=1 Tax=Polyangium mundeleinium TaxID=2995306 RepID=A0ABT5EU61_9BACT|nr:hypothetical protein [Polyangium mundeleinium]MDC0744984.1 hypothetical protein [Polyangium mundeleinium]
MRTQASARPVLQPGANLTLRIEMDVSQRGTDVVLPQGRYRFAVTADPVDPKGASSGAETVSRAVFTLDGLSEQDARELGRRVRFAQENNCTQGTELAQRALAWTAPASIALAAMKLPGAPLLRARYWRLVTERPESIDLVRDALSATKHQDWSVAGIAAHTLLQRNGEVTHDVREAALTTLANVLRDARKIDPVIQDAVGLSDWNPSLLAHVQTRIARGSSTELAGWATALACPRVPYGQERALALLVFAMRQRAQGQSRELAQSLRQRANDLETFLRGRRDAIDRDLVVARSGPPLETGEVSRAQGCGRIGIAERPDPICRDVPIDEHDPLLRFLHAPMVFRFEAPPSSQAPSPQGP